MSGVASKAIILNRTVNLAARQALALPYAAQFKRVLFPTIFLTF
jgi:hypothetical protein